MKLKSLLAVLGGLIAKQTLAQPYGAAAGLGNAAGSAAFGYVDKLANSLLSGDLFNNIYKNAPPAPNQQGAYSNSNDNYGPAGGYSYVGGGYIDNGADVGPLGEKHDVLLGRRSLSEGAIGDIGNERFFTNRAFAFKTKGKFTRDSNVLVCSGLNVTKEHNKYNSQESNEPPYHRPSESSDEQRYNTVTMTGASFQGNYGDYAAGMMESDTCGTKVELFEKGDAFASIGSICTDSLFTCSMQTMASINGFFTEFFTDARDPTSCLVERVAPDVVLACFKLTPRIKRSEFMMYNRSADNNVAKFCWSLQAINPGAFFILRRPFKQLNVPYNNYGNRANYQSASSLNDDSIYTSQYYNPAAGTGGSMSYDGYSTTPAGFRKQDILVESGIAKMLKTRQFDFFAENKKEKRDIHDIHNIHEQSSDEKHRPPYGPGGPGPAGLNNYGGPAGFESKDHLEKHEKRAIFFQCPRFVY